MGKALAKLAQSQQRQSDRARRDALPKQERGALRAIRREAKQRKSFLTSGGKGGLPPSLVLGIFRRDGFTCKACGEPGTKENGGLGVHHKAGTPNLVGPALRKKGHVNDPNNLVSICNRCHDSVHDLDRKVGEENSGADASE